MTDVLISLLETESQITSHYSSRAKKPHLLAPYKLHDASLFPEWYLGFREAFSRLGSAFNYYLLLDEEPYRLALASQTKDKCNVIFNEVLALFSNSFIEGLGKHLAPKFRYNVCSRGRVESEVVDAMAALAAESNPFAWLLRENELYTQAMCQHECKPLLRFYVAFQYSPKVTFYRATCPLLHSLTSPDDKLFFLDNAEELVPKDTSKLDFKLMALALDEFVERLRDSNRLSRKHAPRAPIMPGASSTTKPA